MAGSKTIPFDMAAAPVESDISGTQILSNYSAEVPALELAELELRRAQAAEIAFLAQMLPDDTRTAIAGVHEPAHKIAELEARMEARKRDLGAARSALAEARRAAAEADLQAGFLARPAAAIRDRLKRAEEIRAKAAEASEAGHYALAYWLVMPGGQLDRAIRAEPAIVPADQLAAARAAAAARRTDTRERVAEITAQVAALDASLEEDRARLATWKSRSDASILDELSRLDSATDTAS